MCHLGHILTWNLDDSSEVRRISESFNRQFYAFLNRFNGLKDIELTKQLYVTFCSSFYGLEAVFPSDVQSSARQFLKKSVNLALMRLLGLPRESVSQFLFAEGIPNVENIWRIRNFCFAKSLLQSESPISRFLAQKLSHEIDGIGQYLKIFWFSDTKTTVEKKCRMNWTVAKNHISPTPETTI